MLISMLVKRSDGWLHYASGDTRQFNDSNGSGVDTCSGWTVLPDLRV